MVRPNDNKDEEIATHDKYGNRIPSPSEFNFKEFGSETTNSHYKLVSDEDRFHIWWALTRKKYWEMLPRGPYRS